MAVCANTLGLILDLTRKSFQLCAGFERHFVPVAVEESFRIHHEIPFTSDDENYKSSAMFRFLLLT